MPLAKRLFCLSSGNEKLQLEKNSLPCGLNQNKAAPVPLPLAGQGQGWRPGQSEGLSTGHGPFSSGCFSWQQLLGTLGCPVRSRGRRVTKGGERGQGSVSQKTLLALGKNQAMPSGSARKSRISSGPSLWGHSSGNEKALWE